MKIEPVYNFLLIRGDHEDLTACLGLLGLSSDRSARLTMQNLIPKPESIAAGSWEKLQCWWEKTHWGFMKDPVLFAASLSTSTPPDMRPQFVANIITYDGSFYRAAKALAEKVYRCSYVLDVPGLDGAVVKSFFFENGVEVRADSSLRLEEQAAIEAFSAAEYPDTSGRFVPIDLPPPNVNEFEHIQKEILDLVYKAFALPPDSLNEEQKNAVVHKVAEFVLEDEGVFAAVEDVRRSRAGSDSSSTPGYGAGEPSRTGD